MSFASKYNALSARQGFSIDTTGFQYKTLKDLYNPKQPNRAFALRGVFINTKSQFGEQPILITDRCFVNAPRFMLDTIKEMMQDPEAIEAMENGLAGFSIYQYENKKYNKRCFAIKFLDANTQDEDLPF